MISGPKLRENFSWDQQNLLSVRNTYDKKMTIYSKLFGLKGSTL